MARQALKSLSRQRLMYADIPDFFELLKTETERMGAILAAAGVEDGLEYAIENQFMRGLSKTEFQRYSTVMTCWVHLVPKLKWVTPHDCTATLHRLTSIA